MKELSGKVAFITGGTTGLGLGITRAFLECNMNVVMSYRRPETLRTAMQSLTEEQRRRVFALELDVTDRRAMAHAASAAERAFEKIHVLCNNAGVFMFCPLDEATEDDWDWMINVNLNGVFNGLRYIVPRIKAHGEGGHVINTASMSAFIPGPSLGIYAASKCAIRGLTECLRYDLAASNIGVSLLCPGLVKSAIHESTKRRPPHGATGAIADDAFHEQLRNAFALGMDPIDVGREVVAGLRENRRYIFSHPEFTDEVRTIFDEVIAAMPRTCVESPRRPVEEARRQRTLAARQRADALL